MSEVIYTRCDGCGSVKDACPELAIAVPNQWIEDDYGNHFCKECQETAEDLEKSTPEPQEMELFATAINKTIEKARRKI